MLPKEAVEQFKDIYKKLAGKDLTDVEATEYANDLFDYLHDLILPTEEDNLITTHHEKWRN